MAFKRIRLCDGHTDEHQSRAHLLQSCALSLEGDLMKCRIVSVTAHADWTHHSLRCRRWTDNMTLRHSLAKKGESLHLGVMGIIVQCKRNSHVKLTVVFTVDAHTKGKNSEKVKWFLLWMAWEAPVLENGIRGMYSQPILTVHCAQWPSPDWNYLFHPVADCKSNIALKIDTLSQYHCVLNVIAVVFPKTTAVFR